MDKNISLETKEKWNIEEHFGLVHMIVNRYLGRGMEREDLFQIGCVGLVKAFERFDETKAGCFSTYAVPMIQGEIRRAFRDSCKIHMGRHLQELGLKVNAVQKAYEMEFAVSPTMNEIAQILQVEEEEVIMCIAGKEVGSLDVPIPGKDGGGQTLIEQIEGSGENDDTWTDRIAIKQALEQLSEREREVVRMRFFQGKSQKQIASEIALSQPQICRIEKGALSSLKTLLG